MDKVKFHPFILVNLFISAVAMGLYAYTMYQDNKVSYTFTFIILCFFFITLGVYGLFRNQR